MTVQKYRKKPVVIEAMRLTGSSVDHMAVCDWLIACGYPWLIGNALEPETLVAEGDPEEKCPAEKGIWIEPQTGDLMIRTLEGDMRTPYGWWVIRGVKGEMYSCENSIFELTYEYVGSLNFSSKIRSGEPHPYRAGSPTGHSCGQMLRYGEAVEGMCGAASKDPIHSAEI